MSSANKHKINLLVWQELNGVSLLGWGGRERVVGSFYGQNSPLQKSVRSCVVVSHCEELGALLPSIAFLAASPLSPLYFSQPPLSPLLFLLPSLAFFTASPYSLPCISRSLPSLPCISRSLPFFPPLYFSQPPLLPSLVFNTA